MSDASCLFHECQVAHAGTTNEHLIPEGVGGFDKSKLVICAACNKFFGDGLDRSASDTYRDVLHMLAPLMKGALAKRRFEHRTRQGYVLVERGGGIVELARVRDGAREDGSRFIAGPAGLKSELERISRLKGYKGPLVPMSLVDLAGEGRTEDHPLDLLGLRQWAARVLLCVLDHFSQRKHGRERSVARIASLRPARAFARLGTPGGPIRRYGIPIVPLAERLEAAFRAVRAPRPEFANRVLIAHDREARRIVGLLQIAGTEPLGLLLAADTDLPHPFTLFYQRGLTSHGKPAFVRWSRATHLTAGEFAAAAPAADADAITFYQEQLVRSLARRAGAAKSLVDRRIPEIVLETIRWELVAQAAKEHVSADSFVGITLERVLKPRFQGNKVPEEHWRSLRDRVNRAAQRYSRDLFEEARSGAVDASLSPAVLKLFKKESAGLRAKFGPPLHFDFLGMVRTPAKE